MIKNVLFTALLLLALGFSAFLLTPIFFEAPAIDVDSIDEALIDEARLETSSHASSMPGFTSSANQPEKREAPTGYRPSGHIKVDGARFVDENGYPIIFKGLAISDPDKIAIDGRWNKKHFETIKSWGANLVRIPVHPSRFRSRGKENYLRLLDQAVAWCGELEMYVIIDWHSIGNLKARKFESDEYVTSIEETVDFWKVVSQRFAGNPTVAFYEIFNEPTLGFGDFGQCTWAQWKTIAEEIIDAIYTNDNQVIPLVAGFDWAYDLREVKANPVDRPGVAYVAHLYPGKCQPPREPHWQQRFGFLADRYPVFVTEMGFCLEGDYDYMIDDGTFQNSILKYLKAKKFSWCVWIFDPDWSPPLIKGYDYAPTHSGRFFKDAMRATGKENN